MQSLLFILLIISVACGVHISATDPAPVAPKQQRKINDISLLWAGIALFKFTFWTHAFIEVLILATSSLLEQFPDSNFINQTGTTLMQTFLLMPTAQDSNIHLTSVRILGGVLIITGSFIRYWCFQELGRHFTFDVAILRNHELVTTGPYSIVRHPSYTGAISIAVGAMIWHGTSGSWVRESNFYQFKVFWIIVSLMTVFLGRASFLSISRCVLEDALLKKEFGKKWKKWAKEVPYRLIPGLY